MEEIIKHFGTGFLYLIAGAGTVGIYISCIKIGGVLNTVVVNYMNGICG